jgi:hypothetical protein
MAIRRATHVLKNSNIVNRPLPSILKAGEPIVNTAEGIMYFSGVTTSTNEWTSAGTGTTANFFEVGSNLYDLVLRNQLIEYQGVSGAGLVDKYLKGTSSGFVLDDISNIQGIDSYLTGATFNNTNNLLTLALNEGKPNVTTTIDANHNLLSNLQGGTSGEYYHTTQTIHDGLTGATNPSSSNPFATIADIAASSGDTQQVKVSSNDTTPGFLEDKVTGGTNVTITTLNDGGNELLQISSTDTNNYVTGNTLTPSNNNTPTQSAQLDYNITPAGGPYFIVTENTFVTGGTLNGTTIELDYNDSTITGNTIDLSGLDVNDTFSTGTTNSVSATNNSNVQSTDITGNDGFTDFTVSFTDTFVTGGTLTGSDLVLTRNDGTQVTTDLSSLDVNDTFVTGFTYNNANTFTITRNEGQPDLTATINTVTGMTNTGNLDLQGELSNSTGNVVINDNLDITGTTTSWGNILPGAHLTYDLGASGQRWDELWVRKIQIGTTTTTLSEEGGNFEMSGNTGDFVFKPSVNSTFHSDVLPDADLTRAIGSPSLRWDVYAGNLSATGLTITGLGSGRVVYTDGSGGLTTEAGFEYNDTTDLLTVGDLNVTNSLGTTASIGQGGLIIGSGGSTSSPGLGDLTVHGNFTVFGTATTVSTNELYVEDPQITLNYNPTGDTSSTSVASGIRIQDGDGSGNDVLLTVAQMNTFTGGDVTEYTGANGYSNRSFLTQLNDIVIRNTNSNNGAPDGVRVLAEFDCLDGGTY